MNRRGPWWLTDVVVPFVIIVLFVGALGMGAWMAGPS